MRFRLAPREVILVPIEIYIYKFEFSKFGRHSLHGADVCFNLIKCKKTYQFKTHCKDDVMTSLKQQKSYGQP